MIRHPLTFRISQGHTHAGVRYTTSAIHLRVILLPHLIATHKPDIFHVLSLIARNRESIIYPKERADLHPFIRFTHLLHTIGTQTDDLARAYKFLDLIIQVRKTAGLAGRRISPVLLPDYDRRTPPFVTGSDNTILRQEQHRARALYLIVNILNTLHEVLALCNQQSD